MIATPSKPAGRAGELVARYGMTHHALEGAWVGLRHVAEDRVAGAALPSRFEGRARPMSSAIVAVITRRDFSAMHRLRCDEIWHFYGGAPAELLLLRANGHGETVRFGPDALNGEQPQVVVRAGTWMGARPLGDDELAHTFFGCTLAPAYAPEDYEPGRRAELCRAWPEHASLIRALTREDA